MDPTFLPNWPEGKHRKWQTWLGLTYPPPELYLALLLKTGCLYDIEKTAGFWKFGLAALTIPFVDRLSDGHTPFLYIAATWHDNAFAILLASAFSNIKSNPSVITPHPRTKHAHFLREDNGASEGFSAHGIHDGSGVESSLTQTASAPWSASSLNDLMNMPLFGPYSDLCMIVSTPRSPQRSGYSFANNFHFTSKHIQHQIKGHSFLRGSVTIRAPSLFDGEKVFLDVFVSVTVYFVGG